MTEITEALDPEEIVPHESEGAWQQRVALPDSASQAPDSPHAPPFLRGTDRPIGVRHPQALPSRHLASFSPNEYRPSENSPTSHPLSSDRRRPLESSSASPSPSTGSAFNSPTAPQQPPRKFEPNRRTPSSDRSNASPAPTNLTSGQATTVASPPPVLRPSANPTTLAQNTSNPSARVHVEVEENPDCDIGDLVYRVRELKSQVAFLEKKLKDTRTSYKILGNTADKLFAGHGLDTVMPRRPATKPCRYKVIDQKGVIIPCECHEDEQMAYSGLCSHPRLVCDLVPTNIRLEDSVKYYQWVWKAGGLDHYEFFKLIISSGVVLCSVPYPHDEMFRSQELPLFGKFDGEGEDAGRG